MHCWGSGDPEVNSFALVSSNDVIKVMAILLATNQSGLTIIAYKKLLQPGHSLTNTKPKLWEADKGKRTSTSKKKIEHRKDSVGGQDLILPSSSNKTL